MGNRKSDTRGEKALGLFLDHYYYPRLCDLESLKSVQRVFDVNEQKAGVDVLLTDSKGTTVVVDEKAQLHYINNPRDTFAFEVSYYSDKTGELSKGWFIDENNKTDYYLLVWIESARNEQLNRIVEEDFEESLVALISGRKIKQYLITIGYPIERIVELSKEMRNDWGKNICRLSENAFIYYTKEGYDEKPINVVIDKAVLWQLAFGVYKVNRSNCIKLTK